MTLAKPLPDFGVEVHCSRWEFSARYHLTASDAETLTVSELIALAGPGARDQLDELPLGYTPTWGTERLRAAIAATYDRLEPEHILVFAGAGEALFWPLQELVGPGDHAVVLVPTYQSMESVTLATGADVVASRSILRRAGRWTSTGLRRCCVLPLDSWS